MTFKLEGTKDHECSTLHEHCIKIAQAKKGPSQTDGARLEKTLTQQQKERWFFETANAFAKKASDFE